MYTAKSSDNTSDNEDPIMVFNKVGIWRCDQCIHSVVEKCSECGHDKFKCTKLNTNVDADFFCKNWKSKNYERIDYPYHPYEQWPECPYPHEPTYPPYKPIWIYISDTETPVGKKWELLKKEWGKKYYI